MTPSESRQQRKDNYYINIAEAVAMNSTCMRRAYGAIIVKNDEIIATGYNGSPRGCINCKDAGCMRDALGIEKGDAYNLCTSVHAEMNCIISAARRDMIGSTLYIVGVNSQIALREKCGMYADPTPCLLCHRMIINAGITRCVGIIDDPEHAEFKTPRIVEIDVSAKAFQSRIIFEYGRVATDLAKNAANSDTVSAIEAMRTRRMALMEVKEYQNEVSQSESSEHT